jgi:hypothetical protein
VEGSVVLTVITDDRPRVPNGSVIVPDGLHTSAGSSDGRDTASVTEATVERRR